MAGIPLDQVRIFASPFSRTLETAKVVADSMGVLMNAKPTIKVSSSGFDEVVMFISTSRIPILVTSLR